MAATTTFNDVRQMLRRWDKVVQHQSTRRVLQITSNSFHRCLQGSKSVRATMLQDFLFQCENMTAPELEQQFCDCASLFLARLTAWLRLS